MNPYDKFLVLTIFFLFSSFGCKSRANRSAIKDKTPPISVEDRNTYAWIFDSFYYKPEKPNQDLSGICLYQAPLHTDPEERPDALVPLTKNAQSYREFREWYRTIYPTLSHTEGTADDTLTQTIESSRGLIKRHNGSLAIKWAELNFALSLRDSHIQSYETLVTGRKQISDAEECPKSFYEIPKPRMDLIGAGFIEVRNTGGQRYHPSEKLTYEPANLGKAANHYVMFRGKFLPGSGTLGQFDQFGWVKPGAKPGEFIFTDWLDGYAGPIDLLSPGMQIEEMSILSSIKSERN